VVIRQYDWASFSKVLYYNDDDEDDRMRNVDDDDVNLEEGSGDSNDDVILNFIDDVSHMVLWFSVTNNNSTYSSGKRKARQYSTTQGEKK